MTIHALDPHFLMVGDCVDWLSRLDPDSIDAVCTDPPYGLGFMGKAWDCDVPGEAFAQALFRVCKPGAHVAAFGGTRTFHRLAVALEDAGFEIRDCLSWLYGTGFPKSLDVSKAIDKLRDDEGEVRIVCRWLRAAIDAHPTQTVQTIADAFGFHSRMVDHWAARDTDSQPCLPTLEQWDRLLELLGRPATPADVARLVVELNTRKGQPGAAWHEREVVGTATGKDAVAGDLFAPGSGVYLPKEYAVTAPATDAAARWHGWGTALKPAWEPISLARKPLIGTVAANVLELGTGAIHVDATRVGDRWPANVALDDVAAAELGPASRFFYCAKASTSEREAGLAGRLPIRSGGELTDRVDGSAGLSSPRAGAGRRGGRRNHHPTVKPVALIRWLLKLIVPPGGMVLDPFVGSGTTFLAADGLDCVVGGVERDPDYAALAIARWQGRMELST